ncbi:hypothetical protein TP2_14455 [Thioclava pacifica DSM 10166]|uniref:Uncharacterized protein n=1 Tax=Thioclava pacifica DSM 10166 TaxID=1353537 RepID=A0A074J0B9_9RHOB|nr:hypothetical protein TP2_14455 [Thioclava pacifica DSM 10166]
MIFLTHACVIHTIMRILIEDMMKTENTPELESPARRAALKAVSKYATLGAGASIVVLSSADAVKANANSNGCNGSSGGANGCS